MPTPVFDERDTATLRRGAVLEGVMLAGLQTSPKLRTAAAR